MYLYEEFKSGQIIIESIQKETIRKLTKRQMQVFILYGIGKNQKEIATILNISTKTVTSHRENILIRLDLEGNHGLMSLCIHNQMDSDEFMNTYL